MNTPVPATSNPTPKSLCDLTAGEIGDVLLESAGEALILAWLVLLLGGIAVDIVGGMWRDMTPTPPPGLARKQVLEAEPSAVWNASSAWVHQHRFALLFALIFTGKSAARLLKYSGNDNHRQAAAWTNRILSAVSKEWFSLVVGNAFSAFWVAMALQWAQAFSWSQILWECLGDAFHPALQALGSLVPGGNFLGNLYAWYQANQFKFTFWLIYSAGICDDLGLPNYKTLGRWLWRKFRKRGQSTKGGGS